MAARRPTGRQLAQRRFLAAAPVDRRRAARGEPAAGRRRVESRQAIEDADRGHGEQLRSLGASTLTRGLLLAFDERFALLTVLIAAFGRAVSEVGAVMTVGGNIDGFPRVMTTAIALETSKGDLPLAVALGIVLIAVVLLLNVAIAALRAWRERIDGNVSDVTRVLPA